MSRLTFSFGEILLKILSKREKSTLKVDFFTYKITETLKDTLLTIQLHRNIQYTAYAVFSRSDGDLPNGRVSSRRQVVRKKQSFFFGRSSREPTVMRGFSQPSSTGKKSVKTQRLRRRGSKALRHC